MQVSEAQKLSKESRAALRNALKEQLQTVRKKVRHLRAKNLAGEKETSAREEVSQDVDTKLADRKADRSSGEDRGKDDRHGSPASKTEETANGSGGGGEPTEELKSEAEAFFSKGNQAKHGKTKSLFARVMTSEQRSFKRENTAAKPPKGGRKK